MNSEPVAKLAKFTPQVPNAAELLFAAGRASARTHWGWKTAVVGLLTANLALTVFLAFGTQNIPPASSPEPAPTPVTQPQPVSTPPQSTAIPEEPWSYRTLRAMDLEHAPKPETFPNDNPQRGTLTARSGRNGDID